MIEIRDVCVEYPGLDRPALDHVSLTVSPGELVAVLGGNGSGKSTLLRTCNALLMPSHGQVHVDGLDTRDERAVWEIRSRVGYVLQNPENQIVGTMVEEDVAFGPENLGIEPGELRRRVDLALADVGLTGLERREPHLLSEGQKQRLAIAGALALDPSYLLLDEPTAMLDAQSRQDVLRVLRELRGRGVGMLHVTHHLEDVADADRCLVLVGGRVAHEGPMDALFAENERAERLGLELPALALLAEALRGGGVPVRSGLPDVRDIEAALWG